MTLTIKRGWDWGPVLMTCGPWREVRLETYEARLSDLRVDYEVGGDLKSVKGSISVSVEGSAGKTIEISAWTNDGSTLVFKDFADIDDNGLARIDFHVNHPKLWYPHGYGSQFLYDIRATLRNGNVELSSINRRTGFRKLSWCKNETKSARAFTSESTMSTSFAVVRTGYRRTASHRASLRIDTGNGYR